MQLYQAINPEDWQAASQLLLSTIDHLDRIGCPLWTSQQVSPQTLSGAYSLDQLHFLVEDATRIGLVFLMHSDAAFWPEIIGQDTLYFHKLALLPSSMSRGNGALAMDAIILEARRRKCNWVRCDCDDRPALHRFYQGCSFELVDIKSIAPYRITRYQLFMDSDEE